MKTTIFALGLLSTALGLALVTASPATNDLTSAIQRGLFEEEANQNLGAAIQAYQSVANQFDRDRKLAATAIFRLGECYRKQGNTNEAAVQYERVLREFSDQPALVNLSRQNLAALGSPASVPAAPVASDAARQEQKRLVQEEIKLVEKQLETAQKQIQVGMMPSDSLVPIQRDLLRLKIQLAGLDAGQPISSAAADTSLSTAASARAEALTLENQLAVLTNLPPAQRRMAVRQNFNNPVLTSLMEQLSVAEQNLAKAEKEYGPEHMEVVKAKAQADTINKQIDEQVDGVLQALKAQAAASRRTAEMLAARNGSAHSQTSESASSAAPATATEAEEVKRIQAMIRDSPDLINSPDPKTQQTPLHEAAAKGQLIVAQFLLKNGADPNVRCGPGFTPLHDAAINGHKSMVELLLDHGANVQAVDNSGDTPLHKAAERGYVSVVETLLAHGAQVNAKDQMGCTPLLYAVGSGSRPVAELLLARGADVNATASQVPTRASGGPFNGTALDVAVRLGDQPMVDLLLSKQANITTTDRSGDSPLAVAAGQGDLGIAEALLAKGADVNARNAGKQHLGWTPLHWAVENNHKEMVALLLKHKADPNARIETNYGEGGSAYTPLLMATARVFPDIVDVLLAGGADPNLGNGNRFPILNAINNEDPPARLQMLKSLLQHGAAIETRVSEGPTPLWLTAWRGDKDSMALLLSQKVDPNVRDTHGRSALHILAETSQGRDVRPLMQLLLDAGADVNAREPDGGTALHVAVKGDYREVAQFLLAHRADPNTKDKDGDTPLHLAVWRNQKAMVELLLANKADPNERNDQGKTPLDLAKSMAQQPRPVPLGFPPGSPGRPGSVEQPDAKQETMAELLRRHGALDDLPHLDQIGVRRTAIGLSDTLFTKGAQDWNHFTLVELLAVQYGLLSSSPNFSGPSAIVAAKDFFRAYSRLPFPDLAHLHISRPARDLKSWHDQTVDLTPVIDSGDCSKDVPLQWGDVVEIPEADHPLNETWSGFSRQEMANLTKCLTRSVEIVIKGQATPVTLAPRITHLEDRNWEMDITAGIPFWLEPVLLQSKLVLISSDLAHVKVIRLDRASGRKQEWVVDCTQTGQSAAGFWLEDGDRVEVPEKSYASGSAQAEAPDASPGVPVGEPASPGVPHQPIYAQPGMPAPVPRPLPSRTLRVPASPASQPGAPLSNQGRADESQPASPTIVASGGRPLSYQWNFASNDPGRASFTVQTVNTVQPDTGGMRYSPKASDSALVNAGYQRDRSAHTRQAEFWQQCATPDLQGRGGNTAVWTGHELIVFGGEGMGTSFADGARYSPAEDTWAALPQQGEPSSRTGHAAVWTGKEMLVWGGFGGHNGNDTNHSDGARYTPATDTWKPMSIKNAPSARFDFPAVWTGKEMLVWGGYTDSHSRYQGGHADAHLNTGGRYDSASDAWKTITTKGAPSKRCGHTMVWTGKEMIVWGGGNATKALNDGGRYNPAKDAWKPISTEGAPSPRINHVAVWNGKEMIVWGGAAREPSASSDYYVNGARYDPKTDSWKPISTVDAPKGRVQSAAVWTGTEMIVWGGVNDSQAGDSSRFVGTGARYNPATDTWTEMTPTGAPSPRLTTAVWTGEDLLLFGGYNGMHLDETWLYSPFTTLYPYAKR